MPNLTARQMLSRIPVRMAEGGEAQAQIDTAPGVSAAYRKAMEAGGQQTVDDYYANLRKDAAAYLANPNAPTGVDAYNLMIESGISTSDLRNAGVADEVLNKIFSVKMPLIPQSQFVTPAGMTSAYERSPDLAFESQRLTALGQDGRAILDKQGRDYVANLQQGGIDADERAQMLEYATERGYTFDDLIKAGVDPNVLFTRAQSAPPPPPPFPDPIPYTPTTVYQPITPQPDIFAAGQPALDTAFRESSPRTAIAEMPGQFDYSPAAKLRPATGAGYTFTPPSITTRPRSLLSPREIQAYGGLTSASQRFARNRALIDNNLRRLRQSIPALNDIRNYNQLRNMVMSGFFGADPFNPSDPLAVFDPKTSEAQKFQAYLSTLPANAPAPDIPAIEVADGMTGEKVTVEAPKYGGYLFSKGGAVKKSNGSAKDELARFAEGGEVAYERAKNMDLSKYAELRDLWKMHPSNTQGIAGRISPEQVSSAYDRYNKLSQQLADEVGGGDLATEAMIALGAVGGVGNGLTAENLGDPNYYNNMMDKRQQFLNQGRSVQEADAIGPYRFASVLTGNRPASLDYVKAERLRNLAGQFGAPEEINQFNAIADQEAIKFGPLALFARGGAVKKSDGSARDQLPRFQAGGDVSARTPLSPNDPLYIREDASVSADEQVPLDELLRRQLEAIDNTPSAARTPGSQPNTSRNMLQNIVSGASQIPGTVMDYGRGIVQSEAPLAQIRSDVGAMGGAMLEGAKQDPLGFALDMTPIIGEIRSGIDAKKYSDMANEAEAAGDTALADTYRQISATAAAGAVPFGGIGARGARRTAISNISDVPPDSARGMLDALTPETGDSMPDAPEMSGMDEPIVDEPPAGSAAAMLDELDAASNVESLRPDITADIGSRKRVGTTGKYVGAPEGVRTPQKLAALTRSITNLAKEGEFGKFWYERSGRQILDLTNGNKDDAEKIIQAIAITSANTPVAANFDFAIQAYYQWKNGQPIETGMYTTAMSKKLQKMFDGEDWAGRKTNNFYNNLMRSVDPSKVQGVTTDLWMMRAFGFDKDAPTDAQYSFVENETKRIAQNLGWEPQQVQAAIWVALKSRMENSGVKKAVEEKSLKNGWLKYDENGDRVILDKNKHAANWLDTAMKYSPNEADREAAKFDYANAAENNLAQVSWESIPSRTSGHMSEIFNAPRQVVQDYHTSISKAFLDDNGNDLIAVQLGILSPGDFEAPGYFEGLTSPGTQTELTLPRAYGVTRRISEIKKQAKLEGWEKSKLDAAIREATYATEPAAKDLMMAYAAARGILLKQDGVGMHRPSFFTGISKPKANGIQVDIGRPLTADETSQIARLVAEEAGHTEYNPIGSPNGVRFINFDYLETPNLDFHKIINKALSKAKFDKDESFNAKMFGADTGYLGNNWTENLNGEGYLESGGLAGRPDLQRKIRDIVAQLSPRVSAVEEEFSNRYGWNRNTALNRLYEPEAQVSSPSGLPDPGGINQPPSGSVSTRPVNDQTGIDRAKSMVEQSGYRWNDVKQITSPEEFMQFQRRYGLASAVSERDDPTDVFNRGGAMFYDEETGAPVAYAPSSVSRAKPEGFAKGGAVSSSRRMLDNLIGKSKQL